MTMLPPVRTYCIGYGIDQVRQLHEEAPFLLQPWSVFPDVTSDDIVMVHALNSQAST